MGQKGNEIDNKNSEEEGVSPNSSSLSDASCKE
jgi:hypothetical protein